MSATGNSFGDIIWTTPGVEYDGAIWIQMAYYCSTIDEQGVPMWHVSEVFSTAATIEAVD